MSATPKETNWSVITGGPCSGKTTIINCFMEKGFYTAPEVARSYLNKLLKQGVDVHSQKSSIALQNKIVALKLARENMLNPKRQILFDRGLPDSLAYFIFHGLNVHGVLSKMQRFRYKHVFFLESLPLVQDDIRKEDRETVKRLKQLIYEAYAGLEYSPVRVPVMSIKDRFDFILSHLQ